MKNGTATANQSANRRDDEMVVTTLGEIRRLQIAAFRRGLLASVQMDAEPHPLATAG